MCASLTHVWTDYHKKTLLKEDNCSETVQNLRGINSFFGAAKRLVGRCEFCCASTVVHVCCRGFFLHCLCSTVSGSAGPLTEFLPQHAESFNSVVAGGGMITL